MTDKDHPESGVVIESIYRLAIEMEMKPLPRDQSLELINHVLFNEPPGKDIWRVLNVKLITEREARDVLMAHSATRIARFNELPEPSALTYLTKDLCEGFERALFGRNASKQSSDNADPWET